MPRQLPVIGNHRPTSALLASERIARLLKTPCPIDPSTLPRVSGGLGCADCGRTVVDAAELTLDQLATLRRRNQSGAERICCAYTVDRSERVLLRQAPNSSTLIAVAVSVLLAACDSQSAGSAAAAAERAHPTAAPSIAPSTSALSSAQEPTAVPEPPTTPLTPKEPLAAAPSASTEPSPPTCSSGHPAGTKHASHTGSAHARPADTLMLAGY